MTLSIDRLFAYIAVDEEGEGVAAFQSQGVWTPMVGADEERMKSLRPIAQAIANESGKRLVLSQFEYRIDGEILEPKGFPDAIH